MTIVEVPAAELRLRVDPAAPGFADTSEWLELPRPWIGQERAEQAARFGLRMDQPDCKLFALGEVGSGRTTLMSQMMAGVASTRPVPPDLCCLHNFEVPEHPRALRLPAGEGRLQGRGGPGLRGAERLRRGAPFRPDARAATLQWVAWFNHHRLLKPIGYIPPAEAEANYYRHFASQTTAVAA